MATDEVEQGAEGSFESQHEPQSDRQLVESLIACDEDQSFESLIGVIPLETPDVTAWQRTRPNVKYAWPKKRRSQQSRDVQAQDDIGISYHGNHHGYVRDRGNERTRCVGAGAVSSVKGQNAGSVSAEFIPAWRMGVEPRTYRYVPDNGRYRAAKAGSRSAGTVLPRPVYKTWHQLSWQQKQLQREIQRELQKEFEKFAEYERRKRQDSVREAVGMNVRSSPVDQEPVLDVGDPEQTLEDLRKSPEAEESTKVPTERSLSPIELPPIAVPLVSKSSNGDFMESFHSRMSALDAEMKRDRRIFHRSYEDVTRSVENERLMTSGRKAAGNVLKASALLQKASARATLDSKEECTKRIRRSVSESHALRSSSEHFARQACGSVGVERCVADELQLSVSSLSPNVTGEDQAIAAVQDQPPVLRRIPAEKDSLTEDPFQVRKLHARDTETSETRVPLKYSHSDSAYDLGAAKVNARDRKRDVLCCSPNVDFQSDPTGDSTVPVGNIFRITKVGGVSNVPASSDQHVNVGESSARNKRHLGTLTRATEVSGTKESLQKLISASKLYTTAAIGAAHVRNGFPPENRTAGKCEGVFYGDAFHPSQVGRAKPKRDAKKLGALMTDGMLPEVSGKRMGQPALQTVSGQRFSLP